MNNYFNIQILDKKQLSQEAMEFTLEYPKSNDFSYLPGQFITLVLSIEGQLYKRCYSLVSSPGIDHELKIAVKKVQGGKVSNYLHQKVQIGDYLNIQKSAGKFKIATSAINYNSYYFFAAGSGITPIISMIKTILHTEKKSQIYLMYGNRHQKSIMYDKELKKLNEKSPINIQYYLSQPIVGWSDLWSSKKDNEYITGRIDKSEIESFINNNPPISQDCFYFICGPGDMIQNTKISLRSLGVPADRILSENFKFTKQQSRIEEVSSLLMANLNGNTYTLKLNKNETILAGLIKHKTNPPYSCQGGICGTCQCKLKVGKVRMKTNAYLTDEEIDNGYILACQAISTTDEIEISFD